MDAAHATRVLEVEPQNTKALAIRSAVLSRDTQEQQR